MTNRLLALQTPPAPTSAPAADDRSQSFRAVEGGGEMRSGEQLLVEAYAVFWIVAFAFILIGWRRQRRIDERISSLEAAIARAKGEGGAAGSAKAAGAD